jgi:uncharacterized protein YndB with AHSA1/START domain
MAKPPVTVETTIDADAASVWDTLTQRKSAMFMGAEVNTDWREGSPLTMSGEFNGKPFKDHGEIRAADPKRHLAFTHFSGSQAENGNLVDLRLEPQGHRTKVTLSQTPEGGPRPDEAKVAEFRKNWEMMLQGLKKAAEERATA